MMEIHTDSPKVAAILLAWKITDYTSNFFDKENYISELRKNFVENYKMIAEAAKLDEPKTARTVD